jgi:hypothetical protein
MKIIITPEDLRAHDACREGLAWFRSAYPDGVVRWCSQGIIDFFEAGGGEWYSWACQKRLLPSLSDADLSGADLRWADLRFAKLSGADLRFADLRFANLRFAGLRGADLRWANLRWADLRGADLRGHDLDDLRQRGAIL